MICFHVGLRLVLVHADVLREREGRDTIDDAEVHGLGAAALGGRDLAERRVEDLRGCDGVDVLPAHKGRAHGLIVGDMREQAQLDLAVVRVNEHFAGRGDEHAADLCAELFADRDVLQIGVARGEAACVGHGHLEARVDAPVLADDFQESLSVCGFKLREHAGHNQ